MAAPGNETEATRQRINQALASFSQKLAIQAEEAKRTRELLEQLRQYLGGPGPQSGQHEPAVQPHETILIDCRIGDLHCVALGFLPDGRPSVSGHFMLGRTEIDGTMAIDDAEWAYILEYRRDFRRYLQLDGFRFVTERRHPDFPESLCYLGNDEEKRDVSWSPIDGQWNRAYLVLRRYAPHADV